jgi:hypothetical protein
MKDYFTLEGWRAFISESSDEFDDDDIAQAAAVVIDRFESWSLTACPNVAVPVGIGSTTGTALELSEGSIPEEDAVGREIVVGDLVTTITAWTDDQTVTLADASTLTDEAVTWGDGWGTARSPRVATERFRWSSDIRLSHRPPLGIDEVTLNALDGTVSTIDTSNYFLDTSTGIVLLDSLAGGTRITFRYGFLSCPERVKQATMAATRSRLVSLGKGRSIRGGRSASRNRIPPNVTSMTSEGTTFDFITPDSRLNINPWPWDVDASAEVKDFGPARVGSLRIG